MDCKACGSYKWKEMYIESQQRFDKVVIKLTIGTIIAFTIVILCLFATLCALIKTQKFIDEFEYVEETEVEIQQDWRGDNSVVLNGLGVNQNGAINENIQKEILEEENNKVNSIIVWR